MSLFSAALLFATSLAPFAQESSAPASIGDPSAQIESRAALRQRIDEVLQAALQEDGAVGFSVGLAMGGELIHEAGYGLAELEHEVPVQPWSMFRIGSITKQYTGAAICRLADQGKLYFDDPLKLYVPEFDTQGREITLRHLLTHTSGIFNYTNLGPKWEDHMARDLSHGELLALLKDVPLDFEPGRAYRYSNTGYFLLGMVIEKVSGQSYADFVQKEFFEPLGLSHTRYGSNSDLIPMRAQGYAYRGQGRFANDDLLSMQQPYAAGSLIATAGDLVRWSLALMGGQVLKPESFEEMTLPFLLENGDESPYGFGLNLQPQAGRTCFSHGGGINGFNSIMYYFPESKLCLAVISNSEGYSADEVAQRLLKLLLP